MKKPSLILVLSIALFSFIFVSLAQASNFSAYVNFTDGCPTNHSVVRAFFLNGSSAGICAWTDKFGWCNSTYFDFSNNTWYRARAYYPNGNATEMAESMFKTDAYTNAIVFMQGDQGCPSGYCVDGFCCNSACTDTCQACNVPNYEGNCTFIPSGQDSSNECSANNISGIATCFNIPDAIDFTWDFRNPFTSTCNGAGACTTGNSAVTSTCSVTNCSAECDATHSCDNKCVDSVRYYSGSCQSNCNCSYSSENCDTKDCTTPSPLTCVGSGTNSIKETGDDYICSGGACSATETKDCSGAWTCDSSNECKSQSCGGNSYTCHYGSNYKWDSFSQFLPSTETECADGHDNDCDGLTDCADPDCAGQTGPGDQICCQSTSDCGFCEKCSSNVCVYQTSIEDMKDQCDSGDCASGYCNGAGACDFNPSTSVCRASAGDCDIEEKCTGSSKDCPADQLRPSDYVCRASSGTCDIEEKCTGSSPFCPSNLFNASGTDCGTCAKCDGLGSCVYDSSQNFDCGLCQKCNALFTCGYQSEGMDLKNECPADSCKYGYCNGSGACKMSSSGTDCGTCASCNGLGDCNVFNSTQTSDCDPFDLTGIATCDNIPDDYHPTWDFRNAFDSQCTGINQCNQGNPTITHTCNKTTCGAQCDSDADCGTDRTCKADCTCTADITPPIITILSPQNKTYYTSSVPLEFSIDKATSWIGYSMDGRPNITITGNTSLTGLADGQHNAIIYANDTSGNMGSSNKAYFFSCLADINSDKTVDIFDAILLSVSYGKIDPQADLNADGTVDIFDAILLSGGYGKTC